MPRLTLQRAKTEVARCMSRALSTCAVRMHLQNQGTVLTWRRLLTCDDRCKLAKAMEADTAAPLQAAGHYAEAIRAFKAAQQEGAATDGAEHERIDRFIRDCMERFSDCERRVKNERAASQVASTTPATDAGRPLQGVRREDSDSAERSWFTKTWAWITNDAASETGLCTTSASNKPSHAPPPRCGHGAAGQAPQSQPPARPPPKLPQGHLQEKEPKVPQATVCSIITEVGWAGIACTKGSGGLMLMMLCV